MWIDTHCHLDAGEFDADRDAVVAAAEAAGVRGIVLPAVAVSNFGAVRALSRRHAGCVYALGIHPLCSGSATQADIDTLAREGRHRWAIRALSASARSASISSCATSTRRTRPGFARSN